MRVLIAEDDPVSRRVLEATLEKWGYEVIATSDGEEAIAALESPDVPRLLILDWMMPGRDGTEVARAVRERPDGRRFYILLLTAKAEKDDIVAGLGAGADDYVTKPFHRGELEARVRIGQRLVDLQNSLAARVEELEQALSQVKQLEGMLQVCSYCRKVRVGDDYKQSLEAYIVEHSDAVFSHGVCPDCYERRVQPQLDSL